MGVDPLMTLADTDLKIRAALGACSVFEREEDRFISRLTGASRLRLVRRGEMLFLQGDKSCDLYVVAMGRIRLYRASSEGAEKTLAVLGDGDVFGDLSAIDGLGRSAAAEAMTDSEVVQVRPEPFVICLEESPTLAVRFIRRLAEMLRETDESLDLLAFADARTRIASALLKSSTPSGRVTELTHRDIATIASTARETVSRVIADLVDAGVLGADGRDYCILDPQALEDLARD
ncbi:MAG TPA: Crp/Fnr family transcriptional regulator [Firmicutes bacterium]|jgi:CRP/FNR family transcriptional regulator|nr:Crp/Fnr family transcriptional regulator [Bacillota bacterium]HBK59386.1 Crp/Fnr family transcriptional regulator [Bacillota bacterium]